MARKPAKGRKTVSKPQKKQVQPESTTESKAPVIDRIPPELHDDASGVLTKTTPPPEEVETPPSTDAPSESIEDVAPAPPPTVEQPASGRVLPLFLGGIAAGVMGFIAAQLTLQNGTGDLEAQLASQRSAIEGLEQDVGALDIPDVSGIEAAQADLSAAQAAMAETLSTFDERLTALEQLPRISSTDAGPAIAAYEAELEALRGELDQMTDIAVTQLETARAEAAAIEQNAEAAARAAAGRAALARVQTGLESGAPLGAALADLEDAIGQPAPSALIAVQDGAPTITQLQQSFPDVARAALNTARREGVAGEKTSGFGAFLRNQFDVRSVAPRDGTDSDAVLSRAEEALRSGRLSDALAEVNALPEVARAEMSDWLALAESRADAIAAVDILLTSLSDN